MLSKSRFNPVPGVADFWTEFRKPTPYRLPILAASALGTFSLLYWVTQEEVYLPPERPSVTYITSFAPDRSDGEIIASNQANQERQDARRAQYEAMEQRKRDLYRALGRASGMDVDAMEREIAEEQAIEAEAEERRRAELLGQDAGNDASDNASDNASNSASDNASDNIGAGVGVGADTAATSTGTESR